MLRAPIAFALLAVACKPDAGAGSGPSSVLDPYLAIGSKLSRDTVEGVADLSSDVAARSRVSQPPADEIATAAAALAAPAGLEPTRTAFEPLSEAMIRHLVAHPEVRGDAVVVHCPMAFKGKGARWLQKRGKVENPYEGSRMLHCGDVVAWDKVAAAPAS